MQFGLLMQRSSQFEADQNRIELQRRLNDIPPIQVESITGYQNFPIAALRPKGNIDNFLEVFECVVSTIEEGAKLPD